jgi:group I intron endonuclease
MEHESNAFIDKIHDNKDYVLGEVYKIVNKVDAKAYIGQTVSHRLNHGRYRPFGYMRRFKSHVSEAMCNRKKHQCSCLANAIRKHGVDNFEVHLLQRCVLDEVDDIETQLITQLNTMHPHGYNLAPGGKVKVARTTTDFERCEVDYTPQHRSAPRSEETRAKIGAAVREYREENVEETEGMYQALKEARNESKLLKFADVVLQDPLEQYIHLQTHGGVPCAVVKVDGIRTSFYSKYETYEESKNRALDFLNQVRMNQLSSCDTAKLTGNP